MELGTVVAKQTIPYPEKFRKISLVFQNERNATIVKSAKSNAKAISQLEVNTQRKKHRNKRGNAVVRYSNSKAIKEDKAEEGAATLPGICPTAIQAHIHRAPTAGWERSIEN